MMQQHQALSLFTFGLRNQHAVEKQAIDLLERQIDRVEHYPEMKDRMESHLRESRDQAIRLEELLQELEARHSLVKDMTMAIAGNMAAIMHVPAADEVIKNTVANYAFEHYEIASYRTLMTLCDLAVPAMAQATLTTSLREEEAMAQWIEDHLAEIARSFVVRRSAGEPAGR